MKLLKGVMLAAAMAAGAASFSADAIGWPANYEGVMLQGFYWDSWNVTGWSKLEAQSDELSQSFKLIWVPNSANPLPIPETVMTLYIGSPTTTHAGVLKPNSAP